MEYTKALERANILLTYSFCMAAMSVAPSAKFWVGSLAGLEGGDISLGGGGAETKDLKKTKSQGRGCSVILFWVIDTKLGQLWILWILWILWGAKYFKRRCTCQKCDITHVPCLTCRCSNTSNGARVHFNKNRKQYIY